MSAFANSEDPDEMQHYKLNAARSSGSTLFVKVIKDLKTKQCNIFDNYYLKLLDM